MIVGTIINIYVLNIWVWLIGFDLGFLIFKWDTNITADFFLLGMLLDTRFTSVLLL